MFHSLPSIHVKHQKNTAELESVIMPVPAEVTIPCLSTSAPPASLS